MAAAALAVALAVGALWHPTAAHGDAGSNQPTTPNEGTAPGEENVPIETVFLRDCAVCHGPQATGSPRAPSLIGVGKAAVDFMLSTGRMPLANPSAKPMRHTPKYPPVTERKLVDYVGTLIGPGGPAIPKVDLSGTDLAAGARLYQLNCAACHAAVGQGGALVNREAPDLWQATPVQTVEAMRVGPGTMPKFGTAAIPDDRAADVAAYVNYLKNPNNHGGQDLGHVGPFTEGAVAWIFGLGTLVLVTRWIGTRT